MDSQDGFFNDFLNNANLWLFFFSTNHDFEGNLEWKLCQYIVDNISTCWIIYFWCVAMEKTALDNPDYITNSSHWTLL